jgi:hypothetical protein
VIAFFITSPFYLDVADLKRENAVQCQKRVTGIEGYESGRCICDVLAV